MVKSLHGFIIILITCFEIMSSYAGCLISPGVTKYFLGCYRRGYKDSTLFLIFNNYFNTYNTYNLYVLLLISREKKL